jgi:hypothetical protein
MVFIAASPTGLLTSRPSARRCHADRLTDAVNNANGVPRVAPPAVAQAVPARQSHAPSGIAFFVSGMYRGNRGTWTAIIEGRDAIRTARSNRTAGPARRACANERFKPERCVGIVLRGAHRATLRSAFDARRMTIESRHEGARQASGAADIAMFTRLDLSRHSIRN